MYGNALEGEQLVDALVYSRLVALNSPHFDFAGSNYTERNMTGRDKDGSSKDGAGRVAFYRLTGLTHLYTVEANYNSMRATSAAPPFSGDAAGRCAHLQGGGGPVRYDRAAFHQVGRSLLVAALDLLGHNPWSRIPGEPNEGIKGVREWVVASVKVCSQCFCFSGCTN